MFSVYIRFSEFGSNDSYTAPCAEGVGVLRVHPRPGGQNPGACWTFSSPPWKGCELGGVHEAPWPSPCWFQGQSCETCGIRMHLPCVAKYFQSNSEPRCPHCNDYWPHEIPGSCPWGAGGLHPEVWEGLVAGPRGHLGMGSAQARAPHVRVCVSRTRPPRLKGLVRCAEAFPSRPSQGSQNPGELSGTGASGLNEAPHPGSHP